MQKEERVSRVFERVFPLNPDPAKVVAYREPRRQQTEDKEGLGRRLNAKHSRSLHIYEVSNSTALHWRAANGICTMIQHPRACTWYLTSFLMGSGRKYRYWKKICRQESTCRFGVLKVIPRL